ncbi:MAG TPA: hypothetical protein PL037_07235 [Elusimicrobiales bacterium]|nr:hypothetical protein [Elusimicrobiales bacterium]
MASNTVQIIVESTKERGVLESIFSNLGADAVFSRDLNDALAVFERTRPRAAFIVDGEPTPAEVQIREILRIAPFLPLIVLLKKRDASKAVEYMKLGAFDCAQSPWTEEELRPLYRKALNISGTALRLDSDHCERQRSIFLGAALAISLIFGFVSGWLFGFNRYHKEARRPDMTELPYSHPSGLAFDKGTLLVSDWFTQAIYKHDERDFKISGIAAFPDTMPVGLTDGPGSVWMSVAGGGIERRMKDARFTLISKTRPDVRPPAGACFDGLYFWTARPETGTITRHLADDALTETASFPYPGEELAAFTCDKRFLWAADSKLRSVLRISPDDPASILSRTELPQFASKTIKLTSMSPKDGKLWFTAEDKGKGWLFNVPEPR